jgi:hypothetical protein
MPLSKFLLLLQLKNKKKQGQDKPKPCITPKNQLKTCILYPLLDQKAHLISLRRFKKTKTTEEFKKI